LLKTWEFWLLIPWFTFFAQSQTTNNQFGIYLAAYGYDVTARNILPATGYVIQIFSMLIYSYFSDKTVRFGRMWILLVPTIICLYTTSVLAFWPSSNAVRVSAFMLTYASSGTPVYFAWIAEICQSSTERRAFITGGATALWYW
jgi:ACS family pantothenate transporter-like MFS transporter